MENRACFSSIVVSNRHFQHLAGLDKNQTLQKLAVKYWTIRRGRFLFRWLKKHVKTSLNGLNGNRRFSRLPPFMMNSSQSKQRIKWYQNSPGNKFVRAGVLLFARVSSHSFSPLFFLPFHSYFFFFFFFILELYHHNNAREIGPLWWCSSAGLFFNPSEFPLFFFGWYTYFCTLLYASSHSCSIYNWRYPVTRKIMTKILCYCYQE